MTVIAEVIPHMQCRDSFIFFPLYFRCKSMPVLLLKTITSQQLYQNSLHELNVNPRYAAEQSNIMWRWLYL